MYKVRANEVVADLRSGLDDEELMEKYDLPLKAFERVLQLLVREKAIGHEELYERSVLYRMITDTVTSRRSPRAYVPVALRVHSDAASQKGFVRDISETGLRVAGIEAEVGQSMGLYLPLTEISSSVPLEFTAVCRWAEVQGKNKKYVAAGFEITDISEIALKRLSELVHLFRARSGSRDRTVYVPLNVPAALESTRQMRAQIECREFSGTVDNVDILDFVQFMLLSGKKALLNIESSEGDACELHLDDGRIVHAHHGELDGREAFFQCMSFPGGKFSTTPLPQTGPKTIDEPGDYLLIEAARRRDDSMTDTRKKE